MVSARQRQSMVSGEPARAGQCTVTARSTGERCRRRATLGLNVCSVHGGQLPQPRIAAARYRAELKAAKLLDRLDVTDAPPLASPVESVTRLGGQVEALKDQLLAHLANTPIDNPRFAVVLTAVQKTIDQATGLLVDINRLGLEERRIELDEQRARMAAVVIENVLRTHGIDTTDVDVRAGIAAEIRAVEAETLR